MTLGFKQTFPWEVDGQPEPTNFREKILAGVHPNLVYSGPPLKESTTFLLIARPKLHTIREDKPDRWKPGRKIEMVYRGPKYSILDHFNKGIPELEKCVSVQTFKLNWYNIPNPNGTGRALRPIITVDGKELGTDDVIQLSKNDGFDSLDNFFTWFGKDFTGRIIHWTDLRY